MHMNDDFKTLLETAISNYGGTQKDYAKACGIAHETISRFLNQEQQLSKPQKGTLKKLAIPQCGVTYEQFCTACGYVTHKVKTPKQRVSEFENQFIKTDLVELVGKQSSEPSALCFSPSALCFFCKNINEFVEAAIALYAQENISFVLNEPVKTTGEDVSKGEYAVEIILSFRLDELQMVTASVLAYYNVLPDELCVRSVDTSITALKKYGSQNANAYAYSRNFATSDTDTCILITRKNKKYVPLSPDEKLLSYIFGADNEKTTKVLISGIGFKITDKNFKDFLKQHRETFCRSDLEEIIYERVQNGERLSSCFVGYSTETSTGAGSYTYLAAITNIIYREQGINTQGWLGSQVIPESDDGDFIIFAVAVYDANAKEKTLSKIDVIRILDDYARDLFSEVYEYQFAAQFTEQLH